MTDLIVSPSLIEGEIELPSSKSHTMRAILLASLAEGESYIENALDALDIHHMIDACRSFGAQIHIQEKVIKIVGTKGIYHAPSKMIDSGNSGQVLRFVAAMASLCRKETILSGDHSIRTNRVVNPLLEGINQLGGKAFSIEGNGRAPIKIEGVVKPGFVKIDGKDSQPVSALLMLAAHLDGMTEIEVENAGEKPWIDLTLYWLEKLNVRFENCNYEKYRVWGRKTKAFKYTVPADFSSAIFPAIASLLSKRPLVLKNIDMEDVQGDKKLFDLLIQMGAKIEHFSKEKKIRLNPTNRELALARVDVNPYIDALPILSVLSCFTKGITSLENGEIARQKECDRIHAMANELKKMGAKLEERKEGLLIERSHLKGAILNSYQDHRIAMSLAIAALFAKEESVIQNIDCIKKSYPTFIEDMKKLGAKVEVK